MRTASSSGGIGQILWGRRSSAHFWSAQAGFPVENFGGTGALFLDSVNGGRNLRPGHAFRIRRHRPGARRHKPGERFPLPPPKIECSPGSFDLRRGSLQTYSRSELARRRRRATDDLGG
jgi:hypothetical protein